VTEAAASERPSPTTALRSPSKALMLPALPVSPLQDKLPQLLPPLLVEEEEDPSPSSPVILALLSLLPVAPLPEPSLPPTPRSTLAAPTSKLVRPSTSAVEEEELLLLPLLVEEEARVSVHPAKAQALSSSLATVPTTASALPDAALSTPESALHVLSPRNARAADATPKVVHFFMKFFLSP
jgi:hypothetical protein